MKYFKCGILNGVPNQYIAELSSIDQRVTRKDFLSIILYFMSDLPDEDHTLACIKRNMKKVHPDVYSDYEASNIRGYFNTETQAVNRHKIKEEQRMFIRIDEGKWKNSALGNQHAKLVLEKLGYDVVCRTGPRRTSSFKEVEAIEEAAGHLEGKEKRAYIKTRVNQDKFRKLLLKEQSCCKICGMTQADLLIASHIKSWSDSTADEKLNPYNGFLLCPDHDALFDKHYISFEDTGKILISESLSSETQRLMHIDSHIQVEFDKNTLPFIRYHRALLKAGKHEE